ncbi:MAG: PorV/PorQ family protein [candidate division KSB1 bacterium]|nr:PorV/PorQ family protein [candidate division KSB1 bacterium]MDZ7274166.1 PorV/PorQ family protein [candidate division KSB1 bacterium]MDZ7287789.1 PorV/PorQ family protein [candidate division KSB1 bacterium]MDZ7296765.1 PorV/PorQ family protein [candidate division KSB1 bacterium]MDZ7347631.1 PorV/PorQ family protein [candidate division KSB1 bacterium]
MKNSIDKFLVLMLAVFLFAGDETMAQENRTGTNAASELLIPAGGRYIGMGGAAIASVQGIEAIYWNPAGLSRSSYSANAMFSHMRHIADINVNYVAVSANFGGFGTLGFSLKSLDIGDIEVTTEEAPDGTGAVISPQFITTGLTYSRALSDRVNVGATLNIINESIDRVGATGFAFDAGVQYSNLGKINGLSIGVAVKNIGPAMQYQGTGLYHNSQPLNSDRGPSPYQVVAQKDELPTTLELGLSYTLPLGDKNKLQLLSVFQDNNFQENVGRFGAEFNFRNQLFLRGGYSISPDTPDDAVGKSAYIYGLTLGAGLHYDFTGLGIDLNYAYRDLAFFNASNVLSVSLGF